MGRSIRSQRGKELRRIQRKKLESWDLARVQKLSNALANTEKIKYTDDEGKESLQFFKTPRFNSYSLSNPNNFIPKEC